MLLIKSEVSARSVSASSSLLTSYRRLTACAHSHHDVFDHYHPRSAPHVRHLLLTWYLARSTSVADIINYVSQHARHSASVGAMLVGHG